MRPLIIDSEAQQEIKRVCEYAEAHRVSRMELQARIAVPDVSIGDNPGHVCRIKQGFKCVLSIEDQPMGWCKHLSVSVDAEGRAPHVEAVKLLMKEFGMERPLDQCHVYMEDSFPKSVNVICPI